MDIKGKKLTYLMRRNKTEKEQYFGKFVDEELFIVLQRYPGNHWYYELSGSATKVGKNLKDLGTLKSCSEALELLGLELE